MNNEIGVYGMGTMGAALAQNLHSRGYSVAVANRSAGKTKAIITAHGDEKLQGFYDLSSFTKSLETPRKIMLMVKAGDAVDATIDAFLPHLDAGDILIDAGNAHYERTQDRAETLEKAGILFLGMGVSGGEDGARLGPSLMPGGHAAAYEAMKPYLQAIAAQDFSGSPTVSFVGRGGAGHFVKMVHNGIEYGIMQLLAESFDILDRGLGLDYNAISEVFAEYNTGLLEGFLMELMTVISAKKEGGTPLLKQVKDTAGQKGTGRWTGVAGLKYGVQCGTITAAVHARVASADYASRQIVSAFYTQDGEAWKIGKQATIETLKQALTAAIAMAYAQGLELIQAASSEHHWDINLAEVCRLWQGGCIIRCRMLEPLAEAATTDKPLLQHENLISMMHPNLHSLRRMVAQGTLSGVVIPLFSTTLQELQNRTQGRTSAFVLQGLRDAFGAHTYEKIDEEGIFHTDWK